MFLIATIGGLFALVFWGLSDYLAGKSGQEKDEYLTTFVIQIITPVLLLPLIFYYKEPISLGVPFLIVIIITLFFTIAYVSFVKALSIGPFGVVAPLANSYALITLFIGITFLSFQVSTVQLLSLLVVIVGVIMLSMEKGLNYKKLRGSPIYLAVITMFFWGIGFVLIDLIIDVYPWYQLLFLIGVFTSVFTFLYYIVIHKKIPRLESMKYRSIPSAWKAGLFVSIGSIGFYIGAENGGSVIIPAVIASASPLVTSFMAHVKDGEKLSFYKRAGAIIIVLGLMILNI